MINKFTETFVNLGLLKSEYVTADREPAELGVFNQIDASQKLEIITEAEQVIMNGIDSVLQAPLNSHPDYPKAA